MIATEKMKCKGCDQKIKKGEEYYYHPIKKLICSGCYTLKLSGIDV